MRPPRIRRRPLRAARRRAQRGERGLVERSHTLARRDESRSRVVERSLKRRGQRRVTREGLELQEVAVREFAERARGFADRCDERRDRLGLPLELGRLLVARSAELLEGLLLELLARIDEREPVRDLDELATLLRDGAMIRVEQHDHRRFDDVEERVQQHAALHVRVRDREEGHALERVGELGRVRAERGHPHDLEPVLELLSGRLEPVGELLVAAVLMRLVGEEQRDDLAIERLLRDAAALRREEGLAERLPHVRRDLLGPHLEMLVARHELPVRVRPPHVREVLRAQLIELRALGAHRVDDEPRRHAPQLRLRRRGVGRERRLDDRAAGPALGEGGR